MSCAVPSHLHEACWGPHFIDFDYGVPQRSEDPECLLRILYGRAKSSLANTRPAPIVARFRDVAGAAAAPSVQGGGGWKRSSLCGWRGVPAASAYSPSAPTAIEATSTADPLAPWVPAATACVGLADDIAAAPKAASITATGSVRDADGSDFLSLAWGITLPRRLRRRSSWRPLSTPPGSPRWRLPLDRSRPWRSKMPLVLFPLLHLPALRGTGTAASAAPRAAGFAPPPARFASAGTRPRVPESAVAS